MDIWLFILIAVFGLLVGILSGMFGIGGGAMMVPMLHLAFSLPMLNASATSLLAVAPTSISGSIRHLRQKTVDIATALEFGIPGAIASAASALLSGYLPETVILAATVSVVAFCAFRVFREALKKPIDDSGRTSQLRFQSAAKARLASIGIGLLAGFIAGLVGVGGGFIIVPFGLAMLGRTMKQMSAISLMAIVIIAIPGIITHALLGHIYYLHGVALAVGSIPGASIGVWLITKVPERALRFSYGCLLVVSGLLLVLNRFLAGS